MTAITAITAQNTTGVRAVQGIAPDIVGAQLEAVWDDIPPLAIKTGMLYDKAIIDTVADVQWQEAGGYYNATATYSGTASSKYATGYIATVEYKGEVTRTSCDTVIYTATFASHGE